MIERNDYIRKLKKWKDEQIIKVITGIRRCGKSTLLKQYQRELINEGIKEEQIISLNFESLENAKLLDYNKLYEYLTEKIVKNKKTYIFLDEIQKVKSFEKVVDSLYINENTDIYITGSNSYLLSSELATLLSGRYVEIAMLPFSFAEFCEINGTKDEKTLYKYIKNGGFPYVAQISDEEKIDMYLDSIYNTIIVKDIEERQNRKKIDNNKRNITDILLLKTIIKYLADVSGNIISIKSVSDYITSTGRKVSYNTVSDYIEALEESFIFYPVERYNVQGKQLLKTNKKYYIVDLGLKNHLINKSQYDLGFSIENIVYFELLRRGYKVNIGKVGDKEIDFVAKKNNRIEYYQVTASMLEKTTFEREISPLQIVKDSYPKYILTLDNMSIGNYKGIEVINLINWLQ